MWLMASHTLESFKGLLANRARTKLLGELIVVNGLCLTVHNSTLHFPGSHFLFSNLLDIQRLGLFTELFSHCLCLPLRSTLLSPPKGKTMLASFSELEKSVENCHRLPNRVISEGTHHVIKTQDAAASPRSQPLPHSEIFQHGGKNVENPNVSFFPKHACCAEKREGNTKTFAALWL